MKDADDFLAKLDRSTVQKVLFNLELAEHIKDVRLFKKLKEDIWEFRTRFRGNQIRLLAFWDNSNSDQPLVLVTHGFVKKSTRVPIHEINKSMKLRDKYFGSINL